jgi:sulfocyanin
MAMISVRAGMAQTPPAPPPQPPSARPSRPPPTTQTPQIDCSWLAVDTASKTANFQLIAGLTGLNGALNFNGFRDGGLTLTVPLNWNVAIHFTNHDGDLPHSAEVVDSVKPLPSGPVDPAFPRAMTIRLSQGIESGGEDDIRFVANRGGSYLIWCAVPGHGLAGMWIRLKVSPSDTRPKVAASAAGPGR